MSTLLLPLVLAVGMAVDTGPVVAFAQSGDGARVLLYAKPGPCVGPARFAEHASPTGDKTPGCWIMTENIVLISFLDGERGNIPVAHLKRAEVL